MPEGPVTETIRNCVDQLAVEEQRRVLDYARALGPSPASSGRNLLRFVGTITPEDLEAMSLAIEEGCEQVGPDE